MPKYAGLLGICRRDTYFHGTGHGDLFMLSFAEVSYVDHRKRYKNLKRYLAVAPNLDETS